MRRRLITAALVAGALLGASLAFGEFSLRPLARWFADDQTLGFGNTAPAPDVAVEWDTAGGAEQHLAVTIPTGSGVFVASDASTSRAGSLAAGATYLGVCSDDAASPTECVSMRHDGTDGYLGVVSGGLGIDASTGTINVNNSINPTTTTFVINGNTVANMILKESASTFGGGLTHLAALDQMVLYTATAAGMHIVISDSAVRTKDFDHALQTDPTLFLHSALDPDTDNTRWGSLSHSGTAGAVGAFSVATGAGPVRFDAANDTVDLLTNANLLLGGRAIVKTTINFNTADPTNCGTLADGYVVTAIWAEVTVAWDGNGTVEIGDDGDNDGFAAIPNAALTSTGYKLTDHSDRGAYLWDGTSDRDKSYAAADQIDCGPIPGTSTQGTAVVYAEIARFK